jgi:Transcriptional activator of glycolytic enzymes
MKRALAEERSPLDASLESVLPGVHQWHHANQSAVSNLHCDVNIGFSHVIAELQEARKQRVQQQTEFARLLELGRNVLLSGTPIVDMDNGNDNVVSPFDVPPLDTQAEAAPSLDDAAALEIHRTYTMRPKHKELTELLSEWIGSGDFEDQFGGIEGRNKKFGAKWRKHLPKYLYSRSERTIKGIRAYAKQKQISDMDACRELQSVYEQQKRNVKNMVDYFTTTNLIQKCKARGKQLSGSAVPSTPGEPQHPTEP